MSEKCNEEPRLTRHTGIKGVWYRAKMFMRGRSMAETTTKAFQRQDQRIYKLPGPLIKKQVAKTVSPKAKWESWGRFSRCLLIIPEDPRWVLQLCSAPNTLPTMYNFEAEVGLGNVGSIPPTVHSTEERRNPPDRSTGMQWDGATNWVQAWRTWLQILTTLSWAGQLTACAFLHW